MLCAGLTLGGLVGAAANAHAWALTFHGSMCSIDGDDVGDAGFTAQEDGYHVDYQFGPGNLICPAFSTQNFELSGLSDVKVTLKPRSCIQGGSATIKLCVVYASTGVAHCGTGQSTGADCGAFDEYTLSTANEFSEFDNHATDLPYVYIVGPSTGSYVVTGYGFFN
jgi:hypothetical protein